jgi:hypothetical protein
MKLSKRELNAVQKLAEFSGLSISLISRLFLCTKSILFSIYPKEEDLLKLQKVLLEQKIKETEKQILLDILVYY